MIFRNDVGEEDTFQGIDLMLLKILKEKY